MSQIKTILGSFVVVTWNSSQYIEKCLDSIVQSNRYRDIIVIDNGSDDYDATSRTCKKFGVEILSMGTNMGLPVAINHAVTIITGDNLIFVNPDVELTNECASILIDRLSRCRYPAVFGTKLRFPGSNIIQHAGGRILIPRCNARHIGYLEPDEGQYDIDNEEVDYVTGAVMGCLRSTFQEVEGFDARFSPAYYDDVDFCWRIQSIGGKVVYVGAASAYHFESTSLELGSPSYTRMFTRNRLLFVTLHLPPEIIASDYVASEFDWLSSLPEERRELVLEVIRSFSLEVVEVAGEEKGKWMLKALDNIVERYVNM